MKAKLIMWYCRFGNFLFGGWFTHYKQKELFIEMQQAYRAKKA